MTDKEKLEAWEKAYISLYKYGHIGRVFKGTVHNLNGVIQAFSMQTELFELMFSKFRKQLTPLFDEPLSASALDSLKTVLKLVDKRERMLVPMAEKIAYSQEIIKNTENICHRSLGGDSLSLQDLLKNVVRFYQSDMYFKHKVHLHFDCQSSYRIDSFCSEFVLVFQNIIQNAITALVLHDSGEPGIRIFFEEDNTCLHVHIRDNGTGVDSAVRENLYDPFVSAWDGQSGLGLYFCRQLCRELGCVIHDERENDWTDFIVTITK
jgi:signal transduction histidine kinase